MNKGGKSSRVRRRARRALERRLEMTTVTEEFEKDVRELREAVIVMMQASFMSLRREDIDKVTAAIDKVDEWLGERGQRDE